MQGKKLSPSTAVYTPIPHPAPFPYLYASPNMLRAKGKTLLRLSLSSAKRDGQANSASSSWLSKVMPPELLRLLVGVAKILLAVGLGWALVAELAKVGGWAKLVQLAEGISQDRTRLIASALAVSLILPNYVLEARKWQVLLAPRLQISLWASLRGVLAGLTVSLFTPNRVGEFGGRVLFLPPRHRPAAVLLTLVGSHSRFILTLAIGGLALLVVDPTAAYISIDVRWGAAICLAAALGLLVAYIRVGWVAELRALAPFKRWTAALASLPPLTLFHALWLSLLRYAVFTAQFLALLTAAGETIAYTQPLQAIAGCALVFLGLFITPSVTVIEPMMRSVYAAAVFMPLGASIEGVAMASFALWLLNLVLPAIPGLISLLRVKVR